MHTDELWQEFTPAGEPITNGGRDAKLGNPKSGEPTYVSAAAVWFYRRTENGIEVLFQKRSEKVDGHPGKWDIAAGGHINYGESVVDAAVREAREEIGTNITKDQLSLAAAVSSLFSNNILYEFACDYTGQPDDFHFDDEEVSEVKWVPLEEMEDFIDCYAKEPLRADVEVCSLVKKHIIQHGNIQP